LKREGVPPKCIHVVAIDSKVGAKRSQISAKTMSPPGDTVLVCRPTS